MPIDSRKSAQRISCLILVFCLLPGCGSGEPPARSLEVAAQGLYSASLSADGSHAAVGSLNHGGSLWDLGDNERKYNWNHAEGEFSNLTAVAFSPEGQYAVTADYQNMVLWEVPTGRGIRFWNSPDELLDIALMPDARYALLGLANYTAVLFDIQAGGVRRVFNHANRVRSVSLSDDGQLAVTGSEDNTAKLWNVESGELLHTITHEDEVRLVQISPKGDLALSVSKYDRALLWQTDSGQILGELPLRAFAVQRGLTFDAARFSADSSRLLTGTSDRTVQLWDTARLRNLKTWTVPKRRAWKPTSAAILSVAFEQRGAAYWAVSSNGFIHRLK